MTITAQHTIGFVQKYVTENENAYQKALDYVEKRGFLDSFGIDRILAATAQQSLARQFKEILNAKLIEDDAERIEYVIKTVKDALTNTSLFSSSSLGQNAMNVFLVEEAQRLSRELKFRIEMDGAN